MPQKFMLIAVGGYVLFSTVASLLLASTKSMSSTRQFCIILLHWAAVLIFVLASLAPSLQLSVDDALAALWPLQTNLMLSVLGVVAVSLMYGHPKLKGWWSPLPWLRGAIGISLVAAFAGSAQGARHGFMPDWRFVGTSLVLWGVCLILADLALLNSQRPDRNDTSARMVRELLRLCAALPALLVYLIGLRL